MEPVVRMVGITKRFPAIVANDSAVSYTHLTLPTNSLV